MMANTQRPGGNRSSHFPPLCFTAAGKKETLSAHKSDGLKLSHFRGDVETLLLP